MSAVHLFAYCGTADDTAMCGRYGPEKMSGDIADVTCGACKLTRTYKSIANGLWTRPAALQNYRKGLP